MPCCTEAKKGTMRPGNWKEHYGRNLQSPGLETGQDHTVNSPFRRRCSSEWTRATFWPFKSLIKLPKFHPCWSLEVAFAKICPGQSWIWWQGKRARVFYSSPLSVLMLLREPLQFVVTQWWFSTGSNFALPFSPRGGIWQCLETGVVVTTWWELLASSRRGQDAAKKPASSGSCRGRGRRQPQMSVTPRWRRLFCFPFSPTRGETAGFYVRVAAMEWPPHFPRNVEQKRNRE